MKTILYNRTKNLVFILSLRGRKIPFFSLIKSPHHDAWQHYATRGGVEDIRLEAKDTKKIRGQGQGQPFRGQTLSRPRTGMLEAKDQGHKSKCSQKKKKKKVFTKIFQAISTKNRFPKIFSSTPQNFNIPKNGAVLEPRTGQYSRT